MAKKKFIFEKTVYLGDTNAYGNVYFARYFDWQGMAREEFFKQLLTDYKKFINSGLKLITLEANVEYKTEAKLYDKIDIGVKPTNVTMTTCELLFEYTNKDTMQIIAKGKQRIGFADAKNKIVPIPEDIMKIGKEYID